ncbi:hypothetical protein FQN54_005400 [Arachnomyces sp. PD_36]|nr:hypothetical protein FQN54_005400 [Arachnomyces sp. PD_36]
MQDVGQLLALSHSFKNIELERPCHSTSSRIERVQDALASILEDGRHKEVYAVGIHLDSSIPDAPVTIVVSSNYDIPNSTEEYLQQIWEHLRNMGDIYHGGRWRKMDNHQWHFFRAYRELTRMAYRHSFSRLAKSATRGYDITKKLANSDEFIGVLETNPKQFELGIYFLFDLMEKVQMKLERWTKEKFINDDEMVLKTMDLFADALHKHEEKLVQLEPICKELDRKLCTLPFYDSACSQTAVPSIRKYFNKVNILHNSLKTLGKHVQNKEPHRMLQRKLVVKRLPPRLVDADPPDMETCHTLLGSVFDPRRVVGQEARALSFRTRDALYKMRVIQGHALVSRSKHSLHPECVMLEYFATRPFNSPPLGHIGTHSYSRCIDVGSEPTREYAAPPV